jgi:hypothetical protein
MSRIRRQKRVREAETRRGAGADLCLHIYRARPVGIDIGAQFNTRRRRCGEETHDLP